MFQSSLLFRGKVLLVLGDTVRVLMSWMECGQYAPHEAILVLVIDVHNSPRPNNSFWRRYVARAAYRVIGGRLALDTRHTLHHPPGPQLHEGLDASDDGRTGFGQEFGDGVGVRQDSRI